MTVPRPLKGEHSETSGKPAWAVAATRQRARRHSPLQTDRDNQQSWGNPLHRPAHHGDSSNIKSLDAQSSGSFITAAGLLYTKVKRQLGIQSSRNYDDQILAVSGPALIALAADPLLSLIDTAFVGKLGPAELGALGVNTSVFAFSFVVCNFLASAMTPLVAASLASGHKPQAGRTILQALALAVVLGVSMSALLIGGADSILAVMGADMDSGSLHTYASEYLVIRASAAPAALIMLVGQGAFRGMLDTRTPLAITMGANALHLAVAPLLIWNAGMGVGGAATATAAAEWAAALAYLGCFYHHREALGLWPLPNSSMKEFQSTLMRFFRAGAAMLMRSALLLGTKTLASAVATRGGTADIAAHQVLVQLWTLSSFLLDSLAVGGQTLVAVKLGSEDTVAARVISDRLLELGLGLGLAIAALYACASPVLPGVFSSDADVTALTSSLLPLAVAMVPLNALMYVLDGILVGASDFKYLAGAMALSATATVGVLLSVEPLQGGLRGVWISLCLLSVARLATLMWRYQHRLGPVPPIVSDSPPRR